MGDNTNTHNSNIDPRNYANIAVCEKDTYNIVLSYLMHNCFTETAESFVSCTGLKMADDCAVEIDRRKSIMKSVLDGNVLKAVELTKQLAPNLLDENKDLLLDILSLHFVELVRSRKSSEALEFAEKELGPYGKVPKYAEKIQDVIALIAYDEPEKSPMFHLLSLEHRQDVADNLNRVILAHVNRPGYSSLERVIQQTTVVRQHLTQEYGKDAYPTFSLKDFINN